MSSYGPKPQCPWRKPPKHPLDRADKIANVVIGAMFGTLASAAVVMQLAFGVLVTEIGSLWIPTVVGAVAVLICGTLGGVFGDRFINWMSENWHLFHRHHSDHG